MIVFIIKLKRPGINMLLFDVGYSDT